MLFGSKFHENMDNQVSQAQACDTARKPKHYALGEPLLKQSSPACADAERTASCRLPALRARTRFAALAHASSTPLSKRSAEAMQHAANHESADLESCVVPDAASCERRRRHSNIRGITVVTARPNEASAFIRPKTRTTAPMTWRCTMLLPPDLGHQQRHMRLRVGNSKTLRQHSYNSSRPAI